MVSSDLVVLETLGLLAARRIARGDAVEQVEVVASWDTWDRPVYNFSFLINEGRTQARLGLLRTRLVQSLRDELVKRNDAHFPILQFFNREDWDRRVDD